MARFEEYAQKYQTIRMERRDGILQLTFHTNSGPLQWWLLPHSEFPEAFHECLLNAGINISDSVPMC